MGPRAERRDAQPGPRRIHVRLLRGQKLKVASQAEANDGLDRT